MGDSDTPVMRYSTSEMAKDVIELVDYLGWTAERQLHVIGVSMGGMIAQELVRYPHSPILITPNTLTQMDDERVTKFPNVSAP
jgi:pimeloyl-ACP methyl ester carboxylesterase